MSTIFVESETLLDELIADGLLKLDALAHSNMQVYAAAARLMKEIYEPVTAWMADEEKNDTGSPAILLAEVITFTSLLVTLCDIYGKDKATRKELLAVATKEIDRVGNIVIDKELPIVALKERSI